MYYILLKISFYKNNMGGKKTLKILEKTSGKTFK